MGIKLDPFNDQVIVRPIQEDDTSEGGIIIVEDAKEKPTKGTVLAVGPNVVGPKVEQTVIYKKYAGTDIKVGKDDEVKVLKEKDILAAIIYD